MREQQIIIESLRSQCLKEPHHFKFSRCETLAEEESIASEEKGSFDYLKSSQVLKGRHAKKEQCYVMQTSNKAVSEEVKSLSSGVEEGVNSIKSA